MLKMITVTDPLTESNCYILTEEKHCVVIDPGEAVRTPETLMKSGFKPELILLTHEHCDHMGGLAELRHSYPEARFLATERCDCGIRSIKLNICISGGNPAFTTIPLCAMRQMRSYRMMRFFNGAVTP